MSTVHTQPPANKGSATVLKVWPYEVKIPKRDFRSEIYETGYIPPGG